MQHPTSYLICATERTGTHFLCDALALTGIAGRPQECFHPAALERLLAHADHTAYTACFEQIAQECTTPNGVFGAKLQWWQLQNLILKLRAFPEYRGIGAVELLQRWLPDVRYIRLTRRDKVRQAISWRKAIQTDIWWETDTWMRADRKAPVAQPTFNADAIDRVMRRMLTHEAQWQLFFDTCGVQPLEIVYEDLVQDLAATVRQVLDYLHIPAPDDLVVAQPRYKKQADHVSEEWVQRYHELRGSSGPGARGTLPVEIPQAAREIILSHQSTEAGSPAVQARANQGRVLRIVCYATQPLAGLPALLARSISNHTPHTAHCVWAGPPQGAPLDPDAIDWSVDGVAAATALVAADVILIHDGEVAPQHQALLGNQAMIVLAHRAGVQHSPWLRVGVPGAVLHPQQARLLALHGWPYLPLPPVDGQEFARYWERWWMPLISQALPPPESHTILVRRSLPTLQPSSSKMGDHTHMKIIAYTLHDRAVDLQPASEDQAWIAQNEAVAAGFGLSIANGAAWYLLCPYALEVTWNGGPAAEDIDIRIEAPDAATPFVQSYLGDGRLSFYPGYQFQTEAPHNLWVRGPINRPKDGLYPLEQLVDTTLLPCTVTVIWQCTRPNQTIRFEQGEPFGAILPYASSAQASVTLDIVPLDADDDLDAYEQAFQQFVDSAAVQSVFQRLGAVPVTSLPPEQTRADDRAIKASSWATQLTDPPPVSCICPTYGRVALLEEAIESFVRQDYPGPKELIVLNDYDGQTLSCDLPEVRVINVPQRFHSVGEKYKAAAALAAHDLVFVWHDDDIYLPHRLSYSVAQLDSNKSFFKADKAWFWNEGTLSGPDENVFHGGSCWRRDFFREVQGYPHIGNGYDLEFEQLFRSTASAAIQVKAIKPADIYYLYRWRGTGSYHLSAMGIDGQEQQQVASYVAGQAARGEIPLGAIPLQPRWKSDYAALVQAYLDTMPAALREAQEEEIPFPPPFHVIPPPPALPAEHIDSLFRGDYPCKISVILPAANESVLLKRTVEQFAATLPEHSEVIVVDNGSTDGCADFLLESPCPNLQLIRTPEPLGVAGARNRGLEAARGEIVVFADAHIDLPADWWQPIVCLLNRPHVGVVGPAIGVMGKPEHPLTYGQRIAEAKLRVEWLPKQADEPYPVPTLGGGFMVMRHDTLKCAGAFDAGMPQWGSEDLELCLRYWLLGYEVWVEPAVTILHYFRKTNPNKSEWWAVTHNVLRTGLLHLSQERLTRVLAALKGDGKFEQSLAYAVSSDVWQKRAEFAARRVRDDDWLFGKFADSCPV